MMDLTKEKKHTRILLNNNLVCRLLIQTSYDGRILMGAMLEDRKIVSSNMILMNKDGTNREDRGHDFDVKKVLYKDEYPEYYL